MFAPFPLKSFKSIISKFKAVFFTVPAFWAFWSPINCKRAPDQQNFFEQTKTSYIASLSIFAVSTFRTCDYLQIKTSSEFQPSQNKTKTSPKNDQVRFGFQSWPNIFCNTYTQLQHSSIFNNLLNHS